MPQQQPLRVTNSPESLPGEFRDDYGEVWPLRFDYQTLHRLTSAGYPILEQTFPILIEDITAMAQVMYLATQEKSKRMNVSQEKWFELLRGDAHTRAWKAVIEATEDFFPKARYARAVAAANETLRSLGAETILSESGESASPTVPDSQ